MAREEWEWHQFSCSKFVNSAAMCAFTHILFRPYYIGNRYDKQEKSTFGYKVID
jgi:hypothetical protein